MAHPHTEVSIKEIVSPLLRQLQKGHGLSQEKIVGAWRRLVGKEAAGHSWPTRLSGGRLVVAVDSSGWMYTLHQKREELTEGLMELVGARFVRQVSFRIGEKDA